MSYYGYKERGDNQMVNWGKIGSDMATGLKKEVVDRKAREEKRTEDYYNTLKAFDEQEIGQNKSMNNFVMQGADGYRNIALERDKLMRSGLIKPSEVKMFNQTARDGFKSLNATAKTYQSEYAKAQEEANSGNASAFTLWNNKSKDEYGNLNDKTIYVNPKSGKVYIAKVGEDGKPSTKKGDLLEINSINSRLKDRYDKFDVAKSVNGYVKNFQDYIQAEGLTSTNDIKNNAYYKESKAGLIAAMLSEPRKMMSVLTDNVGEYDFTEDETEAKGNPKKILMVPDSNGILQPQITAEQKKVAEDYIEAQIESQLKLAEEVDQPTRGGGYTKPTQSELKFGNWMSNEWSNADEQESNIYVKAARGDLTSITALRDRATSNIQDLVLGKEGVYVSYKKPIKGKSSVLIKGENAIDIALQIMALDGETPTEISKVQSRFQNKSTARGVGVGEVKAVPITKPGTQLSNGETTSTAIKKGMASFPYEYEKDGESITSIGKPAIEEAIRVMGSVPGLGNYSKYMTVTNNPKGGFILTVKQPASKTGKGQVTYNISDPNSAVKVLNSAVIYIETKYNEAVKVTNEKISKQKGSAASAPSPGTGKGSGNQPTFMEWKKNNPKGTTAEYLAIYNKN